MAVLFVLQLLETMSYDCMIMMHDCLHANLISTCCHTLNITRVWSWRYVMTVAQSMDQAEDHAQTAGSENTQ